MAETTPVEEMPLGMFIAWLSVFLAVVLAVALVALVLVLSVRDGHRRDGSVMWGDVAASGLTAVALVAAGLLTVAFSMCLLAGANAFLLPLV